MIRLKKDRKVPGEPRSAVDKICKRADWIYNIKILLVHFTEELQIISVEITSIVDCYHSE